MNLRFSLTGQLMSLFTSLFLNQRRHQVSIEWHELVDLAELFLIPAGF